MPAPIDTRTPVRQRVRRPAATGPRAIPLAAGMGRAPRLRAALIFNAMAGLALLPGCTSAIHGTWKVEPVPAGELMYIQEARFREDGTYVASARRGEERFSLEGKYDYDGFVLRLKSAGQRDREYYASIWWFKTLELSRDGKKFTMRKQ